MGLGKTKQEWAPLITMGYAMNKVPSKSDDAIDPDKGGIVYRGFRVFVWPPGDSEKEWYPTVRRIGNVGSIGLSATNSKIRGYLRGIHYIVSNISFLKEYDNEDNWMDMIEGEGEDRVHNKLYQGPYPRE